jgi:hypothetical protein
VVAGAASSQYTYCVTPDGMLPMHGAVV